MVDGERRYADALELLHADPMERRRLGDGARRHALRAFGAERAASAVNALYRRVLASAKRARRWPGAPAAKDAEGARLFADAIGRRHNASYLTSLGQGSEAELLDAERRIAESAHHGAMAASTGFGSVTHYLRFFPDDAHLNLWSGLVRLAVGDREAAVHAFQRAATLGLPRQRVARYVAMAHR